LITMFPLLPSRDRFWVVLSLGRKMYSAFVYWFHLHYLILKDFAAPSVALLGLLLTAVIAVAGFKSFGRWKREKIEERRIEVALDALAIAYEARFRFEAIRSRFVQEHEYEGIDHVEVGNVHYQVSHREAQRSPYAVLKRIKNSSDYFDKVSGIEPKFMAIFGAETQAHFELLYEASSIVKASANALYEEGMIEHDPADQGTRERMRKLRVDVFASKGKIDDEDRVGQKLSEFQARIEELCRPIVDATFGRRKRRVENHPTRHNKGR
jgi:hypothetical protein